MSQKKAASKIIKKHVIWAMGGGFIPIPWLDMAAVTAIQMDMLKQLAILYDVDYSRSKGKTFVSALTGSTFASVGATVVKALPGIGTLFGGVSMSVLSGASTYAVGKVAVEIFENGGDFINVDLESAKAVYTSAFETGKEFVTNLDEEAEAASIDVFQALEKLGHLKEQGLITVEEFETQKQKLLDRL